MIFQGVELKTFTSDIDKSTNSLRESTNTLVIMKYFLTSTLFLLHHLLRLDATRSCNVSSFSHSLNGTQCFGLVQVNGISSYSECETNCCSYSSCQMFEWCSSSNPACGSYAGTCWTGQADLTKCVPSAEWQGAYRTLPPPPPRLPQRFLRP